MTEHEIVRTILALINLRPPDGVDYLIVMAPRPGDCRVAAAFSAQGRTRHIELSEPPNETTLLALYRYAEGVRDARNGATYDQPHWAYTLGIAPHRIGGD